MNEPIPGNVLFESLRDKDAIILASNARVTAGVAEGIFRAAKDMDSALIFEIARSECNVNRGYTGMVPSEYAEAIKGAAEEIGFDVWALHADHITLKKGTPEDIAETRKLIDAQIEAGFTSFAIDASYLFDHQGGNLREELAQNIDVTTELAKHIESRMRGKPFGLEVEVGEIGKKDAQGQVVTTPDEAVTFIKALNENDVNPQVLAIANGSSHGNVYDEHGNTIEQVSIDIPQTRAVARALRENNMDVRIAQHGITGTPRELISSFFPRGDIIKGNVATFWQNLVLDMYKVYQPELYRDIYDWTLEVYGPKNPGKASNEVFGKNVKHAIGQFRKRIEGVDEETVDAIEAVSYGEALVFIKAFGSKGTASIVRENL
ncbi:MAG: class II fructose-bisphosphate aldolase [Candidatus Bathyarchaeota archaeon]|nr:class II fructose-bisphosphate aldolase [Candidatus Bathyarchaeota archaeon]